jgi:ABC-type transporter Mla maintaining outer membrane lipid asymmetry ATPase subunit MlaF
MNHDGIHIGNREVWGGREPFVLSDADRRQHVHIIGKTGTGKSTLLRNMIVQDIAAGAGVGVIGSARRPRSGDPRAHSAFAYP